MYKKDNIEFNDNNDIDVDSSQSTQNTNENKKITKNDITPITTIIDHNDSYNDQSCVVYKFHSRPPYEGFVLILIIIIIVILFIWWLKYYL